MTMEVEGQESRRRSGARGLRAGKGSGLKRGRRSARFLLHMRTVHGRRTLVTSLGVQRMVFMCGQCLWAWMDLVGISGLDTYYLCFCNVLLLAVCFFLGHREKNLCRLK